MIGLTKLHVSSRRESSRKRKQPHEMEKTNSLKHNAIDKYIANPYNAHIYYFSVSCIT